MPASNVNRSSIATRPTTNKNAIVAGGYRLLKVDTLDNRSISDAHRCNRRMRAIATPRPMPWCSAISATASSIGARFPSFIEAIPAGVYRVADSQVASRWGNILEFQGFDLITPNEREARFALGDQDSGVRPLASALYDAGRVQDC